MNVMSSVLWPDGVARVIVQAPKTYFGLKVVPLHVLWGQSIYYLLGTWNLGSWLRTSHLTEAFGFEVEGFLLRASTFT